MKDAQRTSETKIRHHGKRNPVMGWRKQLQTPNHPGKEIVHYN
jgi:hypothetical protein